MSGLRVDNLPIYLRPFLFVYSWTLGGLFYLVFYFLHLTCRIRFVGIPVVGPHLLVCWHCYNIPYFVAFIRHPLRHAWMNHPAWYMGHIHVLLRLMGIERLIMGSSQHGGKAAAIEVVKYLKEGYCSYLNPDGPYGPVKEAKKGACLIAHEANVAIVPFKITCSSKWVVPGTWEGKQLPLPFSTITIQYGEPFLPTADIEKSRKCLGEILNSLERDLG